MEFAEFNWAPSAPGLHLLEVHGRGRGDWGSPASVVVEVVGGNIGEGSTTTISGGTTTSTETTGDSAATTTSVAKTTTSTKPATTTSVATTTTPATTTPATTTSASTTTTVCDLAVPSPQGPAGADTTSPTLTWTYSGCREPDGFEVQVSRTADFARLEWQGSVSGGARSVQVSVGANCVTYYWRIRTYDKRVFGAWSAVSSFFVQTGRVCP